MISSLIKNTKKIIKKSNPALASQIDIEAAISCVAEFNSKEFLPLKFREYFDEISEAIAAGKDSYKSSCHKTPLFKTNNRKRIKFDFIDLFAGIGGFRLALQNQGGRCIFSSEWETGARSTYVNNYNSLPFGDINLYAGQSVSDEEIDESFPYHDVLTAGFPCQPFSHAGVSARTALGIKHGFECDTQGTLFYVVARIANIKRPKVLFLENVKNIRTHDKGATFETIKKTIDEIGYKFFPKVIDSSSLVAQRRVRCYMVCVRKDIFEQKGEYEFPNFEDAPIPLSSILEHSPDDSYTISDKLWKGHIKRTAKNIERGTGFTAHLADLEKPSNTIVSRYGKDGKECLIPQAGKNPRKLTISECIRLFGYPETFREPASKTATYKQFGNSVVVPVVEKIAQKFVTQYLK